MKRSLITAALALAFLTVPFSDAEACTGITLKSADGCYVYSRTIEWGGSLLNSGYVVVPRGYEQQSMTPQGVNGIKFAAKYGYVGLTVEQKEFVTEGINEKGLSAGLWPATLAIMSANAPQKKLGFCLGIMQAGMTAGGVLGPLVGGILADAFSMRSTFMIAAAGLTIITVLLVFLIKEPPRTKPAAGAAAAPARPSPLRNSVVVRMLFAAGFVQMTILMTQPILPLYIAELQGSMDRIVLISGIVFSVVGISGVIASPPWGMLGQSWGYRPALYLALLFSGIFGIIQAIPQDLTQFTIWRFVGGIAFAGIFPAINAVLTQSTDPSDRGKVFGYSYATQQFGSVIGPVLGGALATYYSNQLALIISGGLLLPLVAVLYLYRPKQKQLATGAPLDVVTAVRNAMLAKRQQHIRQTVEESYGDEPHELDLSASATKTKEPAHMQHVRDAVEESYGESESGSPKSPSECR